MALFPNEGVINLNVGGNIYSTTMCTLRRSSYFNSKIPTKFIDDKYFIDRNGEIFGYLLHFLRDNYLPENIELDLLNKILIEAKFFGIDDLVKHIESCKEVDEILININYSDMDNYKCTFIITNTKLSYDLFKEYIGSLLKENKFIREDYRKKMGKSTPRDTFSYYIICVYKEKEVIVNNNEIFEYLLKNYYNTFNVIIRDYIDN